MTVACYKKLGINVDIEVNNRKLLEGFIIASGIDDELSSKVILAVDKLAKIGEEGVKKELFDYAIPTERLDKLFGFFKLSISDLDSLNINNDIFPRR